MSQEDAPPPYVRRALTKLFRFVRVHSVDSFSYPRAVPPPASSSPPRVVSAEDRRRLVTSLRDTLYTRCYSRPPAGAVSVGAQSAGARIVSPTPADAGGEDFPRRLSAANRGQDGWLDGWRVEAIRPGGEVVITRGAQRRVAGVGDYALTFSEEVPPRVGCAVTLRLRKESLTVQEGVYCALGAELPRPEDERDVVRLYFNAPPEASILLTEVATTRLNEWRVPFTLKVMLRPGDQDRTDAAVLYLPRGRHRRIFELLEEFPARLFALLRPGVPLLTKPLRDGIGLAESPLHGESFGMHRCRLLAEAIVDAWLDNRQDADARWLAAEQKFAAEGLSLARPHLNPGNKDIYDSATSKADSHASSESDSHSHDIPRAVERLDVLTPANVRDYLRARGLAAATTSEGEAAWRVTEHPSRNRNFAVVSADGARGFFVKQLRVQDPESFGMMRREAHVYQMARQDADFATLKELTPPFFGFDAATRTVVLGAVKGESLMRLQQRLGHFPPELAEQLGRALARVHVRVGRGACAAPPRGVFALEVPGVFTAHRGGPLVRWLGPGQMRLVERVRGHAQLSRSLDELAANWRRETFIHGDLKFENCVVASGATEREATAPHVGAEIKLVDWELADFGEAAWDVGAMMQAYLALCLRGAPHARRESLRERLQSSSMNYETMRRAVAVFWRSYREEAAQDEAARRALLERSLICAAARLIQMALEVMHGQARPTPLALSLFDASVDVMTHPQTAARLLGLDD